MQAPLTPVRQSAECAGSAQMIGTPAKGSEDADANADGSSGRTGESRDEVVANLCPRPMPDLVGRPACAVAL